MAPNNHLHRRQPHRAIMKKRYHPANIPGHPALEVENGSNSGASKREEDPPALEARQFGGFPTDIFTRPGFTIPFTDLFPPNTPPAEPTPSIPAPDPVEVPPVLSTTTSATSSTPVPPPPSPTSSTPTTSAASSTTTSTPQIRPTTQAPPTSLTSLTRPAVPQASIVDATVTVTDSITRSSSASAAKSKPTNLDAAEAGSNSTGPIVGGIVAGIIAIAVLVLALVWFIRRRKRGDLDDQPFDPDDFRRSAVLINDKSFNSGAEESGSGSLGRGLSFNSGNGYPVPAHNGGGNPRPPTMIERKLTYTQKVSTGPSVVGDFDRGYAPSEVFAGAAYASTHGHGEYSGHSAGNYYGAAAGLAGAGSAAYGYPGYSQQQQQQPFQSYAPGEVVDDPFQSPAQSYHTQQSPFSPPIPQDGPLPVTRSPSPQAAAVLAQVGGAPVLTRNISTRSGRSGKSGKLSISIPKGAGVNATVVNGSAEGLSASDSMFDADAGGERRGGVEYPALKRQASSASASASVTTSSSTGPSRASSMRRNNSVKAAMAAPPLPTTKEASTPAAPLTNDYVDLARSSVTPFQAAQYAEISKRLNAEVPRGLSSVAIEQIVSARDRDLPPLPPPSPLPVPANRDWDRRSPFADPSDPSYHERSGLRHSEDSVESLGDRDMVVRTKTEVLDFPTPPSSPMKFPPSVYQSHSYNNSSSSAVSLPLPPLPGSAKSRIDSTPPQLPEINIETSSRMSLADSPGSDGRYDSYLPAPGMMMSMGLGSAKDSPKYPSGITAGGSPLLGRFPVTPSPLGASFVIDTPKAVVQRGVFGRQQEEQLQLGAGVLQVDVDRGEEIESEKGREREDVEDGMKMKKDRPVTTVYDPEDAYGGI